MGQPWRTFTESATLIDRLLAAKVSSTIIGELYNLAYRQLVLSYQWEARVDQTLVATVDPYTDGTITATSGSTTITGSGTTFTSGMVGRFIRIDGDDNFYEITAFGSATSLTIERAFVGDTDSGLDYEIFGLIYALGTDVEEILTPGEGGWPLMERDLRWLQIRDPGRTMSSGTAIAWIPNGRDSSGNLQIEFWPRYSAATVVRIPYRKRVDDLSGSSKPIIRGDLVEALTLKYCYDRLSSQTGDPQYSRLSDTWNARYDALLEEALREDHGKQALPRAVQAERPWATDWDTFITHDMWF